MRTVGKGQLGNGTGTAPHLGTEGPGRQKGAEKNTLTDLLLRRTRKMSHNKWNISIPQSNTINSYPGVHYHLEYASIPNFPLNKKKIKKHISS